jgi:hypothetical protein
VAGTHWIVGVATLVLGLPDAHAELIGGFGGGGGAYARMRSGFVLGAESGKSIGGNDIGWTVGVRTGYEWATGVTVQARLDDLRTATVASAGLRYSLPFIVMPFVDALAGPAFDGGTTSLEVALGIGASAIVTRHLAIDVAARDWMTDTMGGIHHVRTITVGVQINVGH